MSNDTATSSGSSVRGVPFSRAVLQIAFLDLLRSPGSDSDSEEVRSVRYLSLAAADQGEEEEEEEVTFVKLLPGVAPTRRLSTSSGSSSDDDAAMHDASSSKGVLVVLGTASGRTYFWDVSPFAPAAAAAVLSKVCSADGTCANPLLLSSSSSTSSVQQKVSVERYSMRTEASAAEGARGVLGAPLAVAAIGAHSHPAYTIVSSLSFSSLRFDRLFYNHHVFHNNKSSCTPPLLLVPPMSPW